MKQPVTAALNHDASIRQETRKEKKTRQHQDYRRNHQTEAARRRHQKQKCEYCRKKMAEEAAAAAARRSRQSWLLSSAVTPPQFQSHLPPQTLMPMLQPPPFNPGHISPPFYISSGMYWPRPTLDTIVVPYQLQDKQFSKNVVPEG